MLRNLMTGLVVTISLTGAVGAETYDVHMLNEGDAGRMIFEPAFLSVVAGDTVRFIPVDRGHNAETVEGMLPDGAEPFSGRINEELEVTFDVDGLYGIRCTPHFAMGMVMTVEVGEIDAAPDGFLEGRIPRTAMQRFEEQLGNL